MTRLLASLLLCVLAACGAAPASQQAPAGPSGPRAQVGYSLPNAWQDPALGPALCASRLGFTEIEWMLPDGSTDPATVARLLAQLRACGMTLFVNLVNWNSPVARGWDDTQFLAELDTLLALGVDGVWLSPVSEPTDDAKAQRWISLARAKWPGTFVVPANFAHPAVPHEWEDWHLCSLAQLEHELVQPAPRRLFNTDCTPTGNPGVAEAGKLVTIALGANNLLFIYDWQGRAVDQATVAVMSQAVADW